MKERKLGLGPCGHGELKVVARSLLVTPLEARPMPQPLSLCGLSKPGRSDLPQPEEAVLRRSVVSDSVWPHGL